MEVFGLIGMIFGMIDLKRPSFIFGVVSFVKIHELSKTLQKNRPIEKEPKK